jgi:hypothetical protein
LETFSRLEDTHYWRLRETKENHALPSIPIALALGIPAHQKQFLKQNRASSPLRIRSHTISASKSGVEGVKQSLALWQFYADEERKDLFATSRLMFPSFSWATIIVDAKDTS